ncbi:cell division protein MraZ [Escherichia coli]|uniref:Transcriptional regulator MraZ n=1 Tax=Escherichia coli TaxID=562 RepID=A0A376ZM99_ECOLX|nr:cell division protein MraZ [Escherichia coli]VFT71112.1 cell division protein MraZ [Escherichia coli]
MFRGATLVNLDSKGRLSVPTRYREQLLENAAGQMVCTIDIHHPCLLLYPLLNGKLSSKNYRVCRA